MTSLQDLIALRDKDLDAAAAYLRVDAASGRPGAAYGSLKDVLLLQSPNAPVRFFFRGHNVALVYVGEGGLPPGLDEAGLRAAVHGKLERLRSRQGKRGALSIAAADGLAWSSLDGEIGWLEVFPPMTFEEYRSSIYQTPPVFRQ